MGISLVVTVGTIMFAFSRSMLRMRKNSGSPDNVVVMSRLAGSREYSSLRVEDYNLLRSLPHIKRNQKGELLISPESASSISIDTENFVNRPSIVRGVTPIMFQVYENIKLEGEPPCPGGNIVVGKLAFAALGVPPSELAVGKHLKFLGKIWKIVGYFSTGGTALDSEILAEISEFMAALRRDTYSAVVVKVNDLSSVSPLVASLNARNDIQVKAVSESDYYKEYTEGFSRIIFLAVAMSIITAVGGLVGGMNTMYTSVLGRIREIATLQVLGFSKADVILSFIIESFIISIPAGIVGCLAGFFVNGLPTKLSMIAVSIRVDAIAFLGGMLIAVFIGVVGALPPVIRATRFRITDALRYT